MLTYLKTIFVKLVEKLNVNLIHFYTVLVLLPLTLKVYRQFIVLAF